MTHTQEAPQGDPRDARIVEEHHITGPNGADEIEGIDDRGRRWYHPPARAPPPHRLHGNQLDVVDDGGLDNPDRRPCVPVSVVVVARIVLAAGALKIGILVVATIVFIVVYVYLHDYLQRRGP